MGFFVFRRQFHKLLKKKIEKNILLVWKNNRAQEQQTRKTAQRHHDRTDEATKKNLFATILRRQNQSDEKYTEKRDRASELAKKKKTKLH